MQGACNALYATASHQMTHRKFKADSALHEAGNVPLSSFPLSHLRST
jgi:hypothetical protein